MPTLKIVGGPRDGGTYVAPDGYREFGYFGEIPVPYKKDDGTMGVAIYKRIYNPKGFHRKRTQLEEIHYVRTKR
jgi:hypothetical protein